MWCWRRARSAGSKRSTTRFAPPAAAPPSSRSTCATSSRSTSSPRALFDRWGRLDILVGNAAEFGVFSPLGHIDPATWSEVIDLNLTANWRLIRAMDPLLRAAPAGRAIFVTSGVAHGVHPYWGPYAISKAGLEMLVKIYAGEITKTRVRANLIDPGIVRTRLRARAFPGEDPARLPPPESVTDAFLALALPECTRNGEILDAPLPPKGREGPSS